MQSLVKWRTWGLRGIVMWMYRAPLFCRIIPSRSSFVPLCFAGLSHPGVHQEAFGGTRQALLEVIRILGWFGLGPCLMHLVIVYPPLYLKVLFIHLTHPSIHLPLLHFHTFLLREDWISGSSVGEMPTSTICRIASCQHICPISSTSLPIHVMSTTYIISCGHVYISSLECSSTLWHVKPMPAPPGSGADVPFMGLQLLFGAAGKQECLKHLCPG